MAVRIEENAERQALRTEVADQRRVRVDIDGERARIVRLEECRRVVRVLPSLVDRDDREAGQCLAQLRKLRQFANARGAPCGPEIEKDVAPMEGRERDTRAPCLAEGHRRHGFRLPVHHKMREGRWRDRAFVDSPRVDHI